MSLQLSKTGLLNKFGLETAGKKSSRIYKKPHVI
jgi:hypothetical protein